MSQSPASSDTQALLQSMLQRLRIQQGRDGETQQQLHGLNSAVATRAEEAVTEAFSAPKLNTGPADGYEFGCSRILVNKDHISVPAHEDNRHGGPDQDRVAGWDTQPRVPAAETGQLFTATSPKDVKDVTSRSDMGTVNVGSMTVSVPERRQSQGFQPKVFAWSSKPTYVAGSPRYRVLPGENGELGSFSPSKDTHITATDQTFERGGFSRKEQLMEKKSRRWTQKIRERWKDRPGSFGKKQKEEQRAQQIRLQSESSPLKQLLTANTSVNASNKEEETAASSPGGSDVVKTALTHTEDTNNEVNTSDFEFSLGSFSLLEEITIGQEWAKFLTSNVASASAEQRTLQEVQAPSFSTQSLVPNHSCRVASPFSDLGALQTWPAGAFQPVSMDVSGEELCGHRANEQMESMEHGHAPPDMRIGRQRRPLSVSKPADVQSNSWMKSRGQMNRKRHHHLTERTDKEPQIDVQHPDQGGFTSSWSSCEMGAAGASLGDGDPALNTCPPLSPSLAGPPKGVLKHSVSQDSESSVEILKKRRRVEENRHVRFSEEVVSIMPPKLDLEWSDPEEDSGEEEDSVQELEQEEVRAVFEEVAPARRPALPAWILSLKNRNLQRKHKK